MLILGAAKLLHGMASEVEQSHIDAYEVLRFFNKMVSSNLSRLLVCQLYVYEKAKDLSY